MAYRERKNILSLTVNQRKRYFWCVKMLAILPPIDSKTSQAYKFKTPGYMDPQATYPTNMIRPKCLHDILISSYTSCYQVPPAKNAFGVWERNPKDQTPYFGLYHRHLIILYEFLLTYVDYLLKNKTGDQLATMIFGTPVQVQKDYLSQVKSQYMALNVKTSIAAHYWNPTNYLNVQEMMQPIQLADPAYYPHQLDLVDKLLLQVRGHLAFETSPQNRWYQYAQDPKVVDQDGYYDLKDSLTSTLLSNGYLYAQNFSYSNDEFSIINGKLNPRSDFNRFYKNYTMLTDLSSDRFIPDSLKSSQFVNFIKLTGQDRMSLNPLGPQEALVTLGANVNYNGQVYNLQYFNQAELNQELSESVRYYKMMYNDSLAYYQQGFAIFNHQVEQFMAFMSPGNGMSYDQISIAQQTLSYSMVDGQFGAYNLLFFPYHTWVDATMEMNLRYNQQKDSGNAANTRKYLTSHSDWSLMQWISPDLQFAAQLPFAPQDYITCDNGSTIQYRMSINLADLYADFFDNPNLLGSHVLNGAVQYDPNYEIRYINPVITTPNSTSSSSSTYSASSTSVNVEGVQVKQDLMVPQFLKSMKDDLQNYYMKFIKNTQRMSYQTSPIAFNFYIDLIKRGFFLDVTNYGSFNSRLGTLKVGIQLDSLIRRLEEKHIHLSEEAKEAIIAEKFMATVSIYQQSNSRNFLPSQMMSNSKQEFILCTQTKNFQEDMTVYDSSVETERSYRSNGQLLRIESDANNQFVEVRGAEEVKFLVEVLVHKTSSIQNFVFEAIVQSEKVQKPGTQKCFEQVLKADQLKHRGTQDPLHVFTGDLLFSSNPGTKTQANSVLERIFTSAKIKVKLGSKQQEFEFKPKDFCRRLAYKVKIVEAEAGSFTVKIEKVDRTEKSTSSSRLITIEHY